MLEDVKAGAKAERGSAEGRPQPSRQGRQAGQEMHFVEQGQHKLSAGHARVEYPKTVQIGDVLHRRADGRRGSHRQAGLSMRQPPPMASYSET